MPVQSVERIALTLRLIFLGVVAVAIGLAVEKNPVILATPSILFEAAASYWPGAGQKRRRLSLAASIFALVGYLTLFRVEGVYGIIFAVGYAIAVDLLPFTSFVRLLVDSTGDLSKASEPVAKQDSESSFNQRNQQSNDPNKTREYSGKSTEESRTFGDQSLGQCPDCENDLNRVLFDANCPYCGYRIEEH